MVKIAGSNNGVKMFFKRISERYRKLPIQIKASIWFIIGSFLQKGINVLIMPIITRLLTTAEYGRYNAFDSWFRILSIFVTLQLYMGVHSQGIVKFSDAKDLFTSSLLGLTTTLTIAFVIIYIIFSQYWDSLLSLNSIQMACMFVMMWGTAVFGFWANKQRIGYRYKGLVLFSIVISLIKPIVGIIFILLIEDKVTAYICALAIVELIGYFGLFIVQMKEGKCYYSLKYWKYALSFNLPLIPHYLSQTVLNSADRIMIKEMVGDSEAGIYSLAYSVSLIMTLFNTALSQTLSPWIYQKIKKKEVHDIGRIAYLSLIVVATLNIFAIAVAPEMISLFAPKEYYQAIWIVPPVAMSVIMMFSYDLFAKFEFYYEKTVYIMLASMIGALLNVVLNYFFIPRFGYFAAGYTTLICYVAFVFAHYRFMQSICKKEMGGVVVYNSKIIITIYSVFFIIGFILMSTYQFPVIRYGIIICLLVTLFLFREKCISTVKALIGIKKVI